MSWHSLEVRVSAEYAEVLSDALLASGADSVSIEDAAAGTIAEEPLYGEPGLLPQGAWPMSVVSALFAANADITRILVACAADLGLAPVPVHRVLDVAEQDWVRVTQSQFAPIAIGKRLWIVPSWHAIPDPHAISIVLDPGLAFGTGSHPTTRLCLEWLEANLRGGETLLDYGCGSGILAIAALKLGAQRALGVDIDPQAVLAATENSARNMVAAEFCGAEKHIDICADIVVANILANPLKLLAPILGRNCRPGGTLVLSGVLESQGDDVIGAYRSLFDLAVCARNDGWVALAGVRVC